MSKNEMESKESMQNTIKSLQARSENIEKLLEKGNDVIVFQFGSHSIRYGLANQSNPYKIRNLIGFFKKNEENIIENNNNIELLEDFESASNIVENNMRKKGNLKLDIKTKGKPKPRTEISLKVHETENINSQQYEKTLLIEENIKIDKNSKIYLNCPDFAKFEKEIYLNEINPNFSIIQPIKYGLFNISNSKSQDHVLNELQTLILYILNKKMLIPTKYFNNYSITK